MLAEQKTQTGTDESRLKKKKYSTINQSIRHIMPAVHVAQLKHM